MSKRLVVIGKVGPAFGGERWVDVSDYRKDIFDSICNVAVAILLAGAFSVGLTLVFAALDRWVMRTGGF